MRDLVVDPEGYGKPKATDMHGVAIRRVVEKTRRKAGGGIMRIVGTDGLWPNALATTPVSLN